MVNLGASLKVRPLLQLHTFLLISVQHLVYLPTYIQSVCLEIMLKCMIFNILCNVNDIHQIIQAEIYVSRWLPERILLKQHILYKSKLPGDSLYDIIRCHKTILSGGITDRKSDLVWYQIHMT